MGKRLLLFVLVGTFSSSLVPAPAKAREYFDANDLDKVIQELQHKVSESQVMKGVPLVPPFQAYHQYGSYPSDIRLYFHGSPLNALLREVVAFPDSNSFVTMWVTEILLEAAKFPKGPAPSDDQLLAALEAVSEYHDKNQRVRNPILVFWPQTYNSTTGLWECGPVNLNVVAKDSETLLGYLEALLDKLGLSELVEEIDKLVDPLIEITKAFYIPPDFDDTFINLGLGSLLKSYSAKSSTPYRAWLSNNTNMPVIMDTLKKYAYRPFSSDNDTNSIDPRTFFYIRDFLYNEIQHGHQELALITTWVQSITEDKVDYYKRVRMPFNVNNVDLTVAANVIYGVTAAILNDMQNPSDWFDEDLQGIYNDSVNLIAWQIERNFSSRPDLALTYYPSMFNFYWFTSRTLNLLASSPSLPFTVMEDVLASLKTAMRVHATNSLLKKAVVENGFDPAVAYFDDFLGDGDTNVYGKPVKKGEDRICSTAMAVNTLFFSWTENYRIMPDTPRDVQQIIVQASEWLVKHTLSTKYKPLNAFFSGSMKSMSDFPPFYPHNHLEFINSSAAKDCDYSQLGADLIVSVSGIIPSATYQQLLERECYGTAVPMDFPGFNAPNASAFAYWSSEPFTYSASLLALTQYRTFYSNLTLPLH